MERFFLKQIENYTPITSLTNNPNGVDPRQEKWAEERNKYGFDSRDTWSLDLTMTELLYERLCLYIEKASHMVNIKNEHRIIVDRMLELAVIILTNDGDDEIVDPASKELWSLWAEHHQRMWW